MMESIDRASAAVLSGLVISAARSLFLAGVAAAGLAMFRVRATSLRLCVWTSVLYASLAMPLLAGLLPPLRLPMPGVFAQEDAPAAVMIGVDSPRLSTAASHSANRASSPYSLAWNGPAVRSTTSSRPSGTLWRAADWKTLAAGLYFLVTFFFVLRFAAGLALSRKLVRDSQPIGDGAVAKLVGYGRTRIPRLATSQSISVPVTLGAFRPTILLPLDWRRWDSEKFEAVLVHELSHVHRRDAFTQCISLLYRSVFWFSPLAWWLHRHLASLAEQASDEAALSNGADQHQYAQTLLGFIEALQTHPGRIRWQGVSMARTGQAEQRLERILGWKGTVTMKLKRSSAVALVVLAIPVLYLAAAAYPDRGVGSLSQEPAAPTAPAAPVGPISAAPAVAAPSRAPFAPAAPVAPKAALAPEAPSFASGRGHTYGRGYDRGLSYAYGFDDEERFVIVSGKADAFTMSGSSMDAHHVEKLKKQIQGDFIWFQRDEKSYLIRDQATIDRARAFWAPQEELGKKQEELGKKQEELGKQQEELGAKMEQVRVNVPDMTAELDRLKAKMQKLGPTATMEQVGDLQSEIGELQSRIGEIQSQAGEQQGKLGELQGALGEKQGNLGEQQGELGRQQGELAEQATRHMKELLDESIKNGTAKPEEEIVKSPTL